VADLDGGFDQAGVAVATCWGKEVIPLAFAILRQLKIPTFILFDGDAGIEDRLKVKDRISDPLRAIQAKTTADKNRRLLRLCGDPRRNGPIGPSARVVLTSAIVLRMTSTNSGRTSPKLAMQ
jgi:putative ATP-dependent endonuclease of OLD family